MPSKIAVYDVHGNVVWDLGECRQNQLRFKTQGNIFLTCHFGAFASGMIQIYNFAQRKEITTIHVKNATDIEFSYDGYHFVTATTSKHSRTDNCYKIWKYTGEMLYEYAPASKFDLRSFQWQSWRHKSKGQNRLARKQRNEQKLETPKSIEVHDPCDFGGTVSTISTTSAGTGFFGTAATPSGTGLFGSTSSTFVQQQQPCDFGGTFTFMGLNYSCCEQFYMRFKCMYFNDPIRAASVMFMKDAKDMKQEGKKVAGFVADRWNKIKLKVMKLAVFCKFTQNSDLLLELFKTIDCTLVETSVDLFWGIGLSINDTNVGNRNYWRGHNHLGYILTDLRKFLQLQPIYYKYVKEAYEFLNMKVPGYCYAKQIPQSFALPEINMIEEWLDDNLLTRNDNIGSKLLQIMNYIEGRGLGQYHNGTLAPVITPYRHPRDFSGLGLHGKEPSKIQYEQFKQHRSQSRVVTSSPFANSELRSNPVHLGSRESEFGGSSARTFYNSRIIHGGSISCNICVRDQTEVPYDYGTEKPSGGRNTEADEQHNLDNADEIYRLKKELEDFKRDFINSQETIRNLQQHVNEIRDAQRFIQEKELLLHNHTEENVALEHKLETVTSDLEKALIESGNTKFLISQFENMY
uniref:G-patch domain-containing protein n=1 Tax=Panagrolaimus sp. PS1159 TaxID=55785 RepID=A0AC35FYX4_9BILA